MQTKAEARAALDKAYAARDAVMDGKSMTMSTEAGTRTWTSENLRDLNDYITRLERRVTTPDGQQHNFARANFNHRL